MRFTALRMPGRPHTGRRSEVDPTSPRLHNARAQYKIGASMQKLKRYFQICFIVTMLSWNGTSAMGSPLPEPLCTSPGAQAIPGVLGCGPSLAFGYVTAPSPSSQEGGAIQYIYYYEVAASFDAIVEVQLAYGLIADSEFVGPLSDDGNTPSVAGASASASFETVDGTLTDEAVDSQTQNGPFPTCIKCKQLNAGNFMGRVRTNASYKVIVEVTTEAYYGGAVLAWADPAITIDTTAYPGATVVVSAGAANSVDTTTILPLYSEAGLSLPPSLQPPSVPVPPWSRIALGLTLCAIAWSRRSSPTSGGVRSTRLCRTRGSLQLGRPSRRRGSALTAWGHSRASETDVESSGRASPAAGRLPDRRRAAPPP